MHMSYMPTFIKFLSGYVKTLMEVTSDWAGDGRLDICEE